MQLAVKELKMSYGTHAIDCLRSDLGSWRDVDGKWVVVYQASHRSGVEGPLYLRLTEDGTGWSAAGLGECTLFDTYEQACVAAQTIDYIMGPFSLARVIKIKIKVDVQIDLLEDLPINVLDALAEIR